MTGFRLLREVAEEKGVPLSDSLGRAREEELDLFVLAAGLTARVGERAAWSRVVDEPSGYRVKDIRWLQEPGWRPPGVRFCRIATIRQQDDLVLLAVEGATVTVTLAYAVLANGRCSRALDGDAAGRERVELRGEFTVSAAGIFVRPDDVKAGRVALQDARRGKLREEAEALLTDRPKFFRKKDGSPIMSRLAEAIHQEHMATRTAARPGYAVNRLRVRLREVYPADHEPDKPGP